MLVSRGFGQLYADHFAEAIGVVAIKIKSFRRCKNYASATAHLKLRNELQLLNTELRGIAGLVNGHKQVLIVVLALEQLTSILNNHILVVFIGRR